MFTSRCRTAECKRVMPESCSAVLIDPCKHACVLTDCDHRGPEPGICTVGRAPLDVGATTAMHASNPVDVRCKVMKARPQACRYQNHQPNARVKKKAWSDHSVCRHSRPSVQNQPSLIIWMVHLYCYPHGRHAMPMVMMAQASCQKCSHRSSHSHVQSISGSHAAC